MRDKFRSRWEPVWIFFSSLFLLIACHEAEPTDTDANSDADTDTDSDTDTDTDSDTDTDTDMDIDSDTDIDTDTDTDSDSDADSDTDTDSDSDPTEACVAVDEFNEDECEEVPVEDSCIRFVNTLNSTPGNGQTWKSAFETIQEGIDSAGCCAIQNGEGQVWVSQGTYRIFQIDPCDTLWMRPNIGVYGGFEGTEAYLEERDIESNPTGISGHINNEFGPVFHVITGCDASRIDGFHIREGEADGAEYYSGGLPDEFNCADDKCIGGGLIHLDGSMTVANCDFNGNVSIGGGSAIYSAGEELTITDCHFLDNTFAAHAIEPFSGSVINASAGVVTVERSIIDVNYELAPIEPHEQIGGLGALTATGTSYLIIENTEFFLNQTNSEFFNLIGLSNEASLDVRNCVFYRNEFSTLISATGDQPLTIANCILFDNYWFAGPYLDIDASNATVSYSLIEDGFDGEGNIEGDPLFNTDSFAFNLEPGSPCIDAADGDVAPQTDADGNPRVDVPDVENTGTGKIDYTDIGPYEFQLQ